MTTYKLTGTITDSEGRAVEVAEFTSSAQRNNSNIRFYTSNGFTGSLLLTRTQPDGSRAVETINLTTSGLSTSA